MRRDVYADSEATVRVFRARGPAAATSNSKIHFGRHGRIRLFYDQKKEAVSFGAAAVYLYMRKLTSRFAVMSATFVDDCKETQVSRDFG